MATPMDPTPHTHYSHSIPPHFSQAYLCKTNDALQSDCDDEALLLSSVCSPLLLLSSGRSPLLLPSSVCSQLLLRDSVYSHLLLRSVSILWALDKIRFESLTLDRQE
ncbi:hypothetical protein IGI04_023528 [Brassica rapa subsp. trilocularis]|uniref:Uncharacterized protein n=1 Tax=Brassica rapa subsp. trilocularis TaxID=1813537 RepID=A0ABQ7M6P4_BRACM|nr:hypothetical protein IGI04_023528 [Brassica rapa subsp. trilocularis]